MNELKNSLKQMIVEELHLEGTEPETISNTAPLFGDGLGLDSLDALQLAVAVEEHFGIRIADESEGKVAFASIDALAEFISAKRAAAG